MINPNRNASEDVLWRLKEASYERMRVELKISVESKMRDFGMSWDDVARLLENGPFSANIAKYHIVQGKLTLNDLNVLAHIFSCEPYIIFRPRNPWIKT